MILALYYFRFLKLIYLQVIRSQMIGGTTQPIVIQTAPIQAINTVAPQQQQLQQTQLFLQQDQ